MIIVFTFVYTLVCMFCFNQLFFSEVDVHSPCIFSSSIQMFRKSFCITPSGSGVSVSFHVSKMLEFYVKVLYVIGKALSGMLSSIWTGLVHW